MASIKASKLFSQHFGDNKIQMFHSMREYGSLNFVAEKQ
jgi:hypothetical protein